MNPGAHASAHPGQPAIIQADTGEVVTARHPSTLDVVHQLPRSATGTLVEGVLLHQYQD